MFRNVIVHMCSIGDTHVNNDVSKLILFDWFDNNLAVCCIAIHATHVNNDVSKHIVIFMDTSTQIFLKG
jgi:hypothetical protein